MAGGRLSKWPAGGPVRRPLETDGDFLLRSHARWTWPVVVAIAVTGVALCSSVWWWSVATYFRGATEVTATVLGPNNTAKAIVQPLDLDGDGVADGDTEGQNLNSELPVGSSLPVGVYDTGALARPGDGFGVFALGVLVIGVGSATSIVLSVWVMRRLHRNPRGRANNTLRAQFGQAWRASEGHGPRPGVFAANVVVAAHRDSPGWRVALLPWHRNLSIAALAIEHPRLPRWAFTAALRSRRRLHLFAGQLPRLTDAHLAHLLRASNRGRGLQDWRMVSLLEHVPVIGPKSLPHVRVLVQECIEDEDVRWRYPGAFAAVARHGYGREAVQMARDAFGAPIPSHVLKLLLEQDTFPAEELAALAHDPGMVDARILGLVAQHPNTPDDDATVAALRAMATV